MVGASSAWRKPWRQSRCLAREPRSFDVKALWPRTTVATAAVENMLGGESVMRRSRKSEIVADAAYAIFNRDARRYTGRFVLDEDVLREEGRQSFAEYPVSLRARPVDVVGADAVVVFGHY